MFINITDSETGNNKESCGALVNYLEKENRLPENNLNPEFWFNGIHSEVKPQEVRVKIDNNISKLGRNDAKFFLINVSPSKKEIQFLKQEFGEVNVEEQLKKFAIKVMDEYAQNFKRSGVESNTDLLWYGKLEHYRYYSHTDSEVKQGLRQRGERKEGEQLHIQIIVSRKDITNKIKLSPMNNSRGRNVAHSAKLGQFDRKAFKQSGEKLFDEMFGFERNLKETMYYATILKNGTTQQKKQLLELESMLNSVHTNISIDKMNQSFTDILSFPSISAEEFFNLLFDKNPIYEDHVKPLDLKKRKKYRNRKT